MKPLSIIMVFAQTPLSEIVGIVHAGAGIISISYQITKKSKKSQDACSCSAFVLVSP
jgi:hypothetical protein